MSPEFKPTDYLLNYVAVVPGTLEAVYDTVVAQGAPTLDQCRDLLFFRAEGDAEEDHVLRALNFLVANDVLAYDGTNYQAPHGALPPQGFRALLIKGLHAQTGKQGDFMAIHTLLIKDGQTGIDVGQLLAFLNAQKFVTVGETAINDTKLGFWMRLLDFLGVVHQPARSKAISLTPDCGLMHRLLVEVAAGARQVSAQRFLEAVERSYFPVTTRHGELHPGVGAALVRMLDRGLIDLISKSDAPAIRFSPAVSASHIILEEGGAGV